MVELTNEQVKILLAYLLLAILKVFLILRIAPLHRKQVNQTRKQASESKEKKES